MDQWKRKSLVITILLALVLSFSVSGVYAWPGSSLHFVNPTITYAHLTDITFGKGLFVAVGDFGTILTSPDGTDWTAADTDTGEMLHAVTYGDGKFMAVGDQETVLSSTDGMTWTTQKVHVKMTAHEFHKFQNVEFGNGHWLLYDSSNDESIVGSTDGVNWSVYKDSDFMDSSLYQLKMTFGNGQFVFVNEYRRTWTSPDGKAWTEHGPSPVGTHKLEFVAGRFVDVGSGFVVSSDGVNWINQTTSVNTGASMVAFGNGKFVTLSTDGKVASSEDGEAWSAHQGLGKPVTDLAFGNGQFVAVGTEGTIITSANGVTWTQRSPNGVSLKSKECHYEIGCRQVNNLIEIVWAGDRFVAVGQWGLVLASADGQNWSQITSQGLEGQRDQDVTDMVYGANRIVAIRHPGDLLTSSDGTTWTPATLSAKNIRDVAFAAGRFVAVGDKIYSSVDGVSWTASDTNTGGRLDVVEYAGGKFVTIGSGLVFTSPDGLSWTKQQGVPGSFQTVAFGAGRYVALGGPADAMTSTDGVSWVSRRSETEASALLFDGKQFVAITETGIATSSDGLKWKKQTVTGSNVSGRDFDSIPVKVHGMTSHNGQIYMVGTKGAIWKWNSPTCSSPFPDITSANPSCAAIAQLKARGVISGTGDGTFQPDRNVTRAEFAKMLVVTMGRQPNPAGTLTFEDTIGHWAVSMGFLQTAVAMGAISGYDAKTFGPNNQVTRAELTKMITAAKGLTPAGTPTYTDVTGWPTGWVAAAYQAQLIGPNAANPLWTETLLDPNKPATRAEAARALSNLLAVTPQ